MKLLKQIIQGFDGSCHTLKTILQFTRKFLDLVPSDKLYFESLKNFATNGSPEEAKLSIKILSFSKNKEMYYQQILKDILPLNKRNPKFVTYISALASLYISLPEIIGIKENEEITAYLIKNVLLKIDTQIDEENDQLWLNDDEINTETIAKIYVLK